MSMKLSYRSLFFWGGGNEMSMAPSKMDPLRSWVTIISATNVRSDNFTMALDSSYCESKYKGKSDASACLAVCLKDRMICFHYELLKVLSCLPSSKCL